MATPRIAKVHRELFLAALAEYGNVTRAAEAAGVSRRDVYRLREDDEAFRGDWAVAARIGAAALEDEARRRSFEGVEEPVFYKGEPCGAVRKYSDTLLIFLLKGALPEKYAERKKTELSGQVGVELDLETALRDAHAKARAAREALE